MRGVSRAALALLLTAAMPATALAQGDENPVKVGTNNTAFGGASAEFLLLGSGARGMALGGAFATIVDDVNSLHYNPAGLPLMDGAEIALTVMPYFADTDYFWTGMAFPFGGGDYGVGVFLGRFGFSGQPVYTAADPEGESGNTYGVNEVVAGLSFAHAFIDRFTAGATIKYINDQLADGLGGAAASTFAIDFGTNFHSEFMGRPIRMSFVVQNLGGYLSHEGQALQFDQFAPTPQTPNRNLDPSPVQLQTTGFPLPRLFRVGLAYDLISNESTRLSAMGEFVEANQQSVTGALAAELDWQSPRSPVGAALRASFALQPDDRAIGAIPAEDTELDGLSVGGGLRYVIAEEYLAAVDYAYRHFGALGSVDAFTVSFGFNR